MTFLRKIIKKKDKGDAAISFKEKLRHFQNLLNSNDEALKLMGTMSEILISGLPFSRGEIYRIFQGCLKLQ